MYLVRIKYVWKFLVVKVTFIPANCKLQHNNVLFLNKYFRKLKHCLEGVNWLILAIRGRYSWCVSQLKYSTYIFIIIIIIIVSFSHYTIYSKLNRWAKCLHNVLYANMTIPWASVLREGWASSTKMSSTSYE